MERNIDPVAVIAGSLFLRTTKSSGIHKRKAFENSACTAIVMAVSEKFEKLVRTHSLLE